jgi:hypothetical protein
MNEFVAISVALCSAILAGCSSPRTDFTHPNAAYSTNADILAFARQHPAGYKYRERAIDCGDANMEEAIKILTDIPHPWTVEKLAPIYIRERDAYTNRLDYLRGRDIHYMWPKAAKEARHCGCLATVLAASRDPRAAAVLGHSLEVADCPDATKTWEGLFEYFLEDADTRSCRATRPRERATPTFIQSCTSESCTGGG